MLKHCAGLFVQPSIKNWSSSRKRVMRIETHKPGVEYVIAAGYIHGQYWCVMPRRIVSRKLSGFPLDTSVVLLVAAPRLLQVWDRDAWPVDAISAEYGAVFVSRRHAVTIPNTWSQCCRGDYWMAATVGSYSVHHGWRLHAEFTQTAPREESGGPIKGIRTQYVAHSEFVRLITLAADIICHDLLEWSQYLTRQRGSDLYEDLC